MITDAHFDTRAVHGGMDGLRGQGNHVPPIDLSTTNPLADVESGGDSYENLAGGQLPGAGDSAVYQRLWQPGVARFENALAVLEGSDEAVAFGSGMAALTAILTACVSARRPHIVGIRPLYGGSDHVLDSGLLGTRVTWAEPGEIADAIEADTGLIICETPANPTLQLLDIADVARQAGTVPVLVDNTFATPVLQRPIEHGAALVLHSATKFIGGHGDVMGGVVAGPSAWMQRLRQVRALTGAMLHPMAAYLLHRGLRTMPVRVRAQQATAAELARRLSGHPSLERVLYPGLPGNDPHGLIGTQMAGPGSLLALQLTGGYAAAARFAESVEIACHAVSLGGVDTLVQHPASLTHRPVAPEARPAAGIVRVSVGLEDVDDLAADLGQALERAGA